MRPGARIAAAIEVLDAIAGGQAAEQALLRWARASRFAGSKDRAAVRDHVFEAIRHWRSDAVRGGGTSGRARMIGALRRTGGDTDALFSGEGHAPPVLTEAERAGGAAPDGLDALDVPDWLWPMLQTDHGQAAQDIAQAWQRRAPVTLRVNLAKGPVTKAAARLEADGIETARNARADTALTVVTGARKLRQSAAYLDGLVELQDASSQAAVAALPEAKRVLDYCAGGGGKALAMAAQGREVFAHDANAQRMADVPARAARAGVRIERLSGDALAQADPFDLVLCDAPCSGSGSWRRSPDGKWALTADKLTELTALQRRILHQAQSLVRPGGYLAYATCSVLTVENAENVVDFTASHPGWEVVDEVNWTVDTLGDGFALTLLRCHADRITI